MRRSWVDTECEITQEIPGHGVMRSACHSTGCSSTDYRQVNSITSFVALSIFSLVVGIVIIINFSAAPRALLFKHQASPSSDRPAISSSWKNVFLSGRSEKLDQQAAQIRDLILKSGHIKDSDDATYLARSIVSESATLNYDPFFVASVIKHESGFNRHAVSVVGAQGLMQIMPDTGRYLAHRRQERWLGWWRLRDTQYNIRLGISYLKQLEAQFKGNRELALIAYNWGPNNLIAARQGKAQVPASSMRYAKAVIKQHRIWQRAV